MPQKVICEACGEVLYNGVDLKPPEEVIQQFNGKCPRCGRQLVFNPEKVEIKGLTNKQNMLEGF